MALPQGLVALAVLAFGCVGAPKSADNADARVTAPADAENAKLYGTRPDAAAFRSEVDHVLQEVLKDPESRRVRFPADEPVAMWLGLPGSREPLYFYGYGMFVGVNAKNSYGGYVGEQMWLFHRHRGILGHWDPEALQWVGWGSPSWERGAPGSR